MFYNRFRTYRGAFSVPEKRPSISEGCFSYVFKRSGIVALKGGDEKMQPMNKIARELDVSRTTLWRYIQLLGIRPEADPYDSRMRVLSQEQIEALSKVCKRSKKPRRPE